MADAPRQLLINGELRGAAAGATFTTYDPTRGVELATVAKAGTDDVDAAVTVAGYGREQSLEALDLYTETKAVLQGTSPKPMNPFGI